LTFSLQNQANYPGRLRFKHVSDHINDATFCTTLFHPKITTKQKTKLTWYIVNRCSHPKVLQRIFLQDCSVWQNLLTLRIKTLWSYKFLNSVRLSITKVSNNFMNVWWWGIENTRLKRSQDTVQNQAVRFVNILIFNSSVTTSSKANLLILLKILLLLTSLKRLTQFERLILTKNQ